MPSAPARDTQCLSYRPLPWVAGRADREDWRRGWTYLTNAVKHFKWSPREKRRIHQRPNHSDERADAYAGLVEDLRRARDLAA